MITKLKYCLLFSAIVILSSCGITKVVPEGRQLLVKNRIERESVKNLDFSDETDNLFPKPNRELLGFIKFHLWAYQYGNKGLGIRKKQPWHRRLAEKVGEPPVLIDSNQQAATIQRLSDYYFSKGFLGNEITYTITPKKFLKKRASVTYRVDLGDYHRINTLKFISANDNIQRLIKKSEMNQLIRVGQRLDFEKVEKERNRLTELLRNNGFYSFNNSYITFKVDTNHTKRRADVLVTISKPKDRESHSVQIINSITVFLGDDTATIKFEDKIKFLESDYFVKPTVLAKNIAFRPGELYNAKNVQRTYANLLSMGIFDFVTIRFLENFTDSIGQLDVQIILQTSPKHDFTWEPQVILTSRGDAAIEQTGGLFANELNFGVANIFSLNNKNVFGGAERFSISSLSAIETQLKGDDQGLFTNFRQSFNGEFVVPSLIFLDTKEFTKELTRKNTKFNLSFLYDRNVNFTRTVVPISYTYTFSKGLSSFAVTPFRLSLNQATLAQDFLDGLDPNVREFTQQILTDNIIAGPTVTITWSDKKYRPMNYWAIRANTLEFAGNLASAYYSLFTEEQRLNKEIFGVKFSQYFRSDLDAVKTKIIDENNSFAYRGYIGAGYAFGNSRILPFERRFFVGGGNNLRAWRPRTIGPGSFNDSSSNISIEKSGELALQTSLEYRFDIIDERLDGAVFMDAGNIWNFREEGDLPNAHFSFDRFYKEIALNTGLGLRFDLTYVVFRVDWGIALHDPSKITSKRWVIQDFTDDRWVFDNTALNFAIGFPF